MKQSKESERLVGNVIVIIIAFEPVVFNKNKSMCLTNWGPLFI